MPDWNHALFLLINASAHANGLLVHAAAVLAASPEVVGPALLIGLWVWGPPARRGGLLAVAGAVLVGLGINGLVGLAYFEPRPFVVGLGNTLITHAADNSFPSNHATFVWSLGAALIATRAYPRCGWVVCLYGAGVAWARVFLGVHYPVDMAASAVVAVIAAGVARGVEPGIIAWVLPWTDRLYEAALPVLHLPPALVPRQSRGEGRATGD